MKMRWWFLFIPLFIFVFLPLFSFAQDNGMHYVITGTIPNNSENNVPPNLNIKATGMACSTSNGEINSCTIMVGLGISTDNPITAVGFPRVTSDLYSPDKVIISSPNDPNISTEWSGDQEITEYKQGNLSNFYHSFRLHIVNSSYPNGIVLMPNTTYTVTIKGGANGLKAKYNKDYQTNYEATLLQDYTFSFTTGNGSIPRRTLPVTSIPTTTPLTNTSVSPINIPTQISKNQNNSRIQNPTVTPIIIKKGTLNIFEKIRFFFSDFFKRLFIKKEIINKTTKLLTPTQIIKLTPTINISQSMADSKQILVDLEKALNVTAEITDQNDINWLVKNKERIPLTGQQFALGSIATKHMGKYGNYVQLFSSSYIKGITENDLKHLQDEVDKFFTTNGFQADNHNTFRTDRSLVSNINLVSLSNGYIKGELKCIITLSQGTDPFGYFFCGIVDQIHLAWRKELTTAINTTDDPDIVVNVNKLVGNYAGGGAGGVTSGGYGWLAVKINDQWKKVWSGHQLTLASCKTLQQYNFPKEIIDLEHSEVCSNSSSPSTQTPTSTIESKAKVLVADFWGNRLYCDPEVAPTMIPLCNSDFSQTPACPSTNPQNIDMQAVDCHHKQLQYQTQIRNQTNKQCPISSSIEGYDKQNYEMIQKYCTVITVTPRAAIRY